ncbi:MAG TPA: hypothetical protein VN048_17995 [Verrucomicrobiae bacterium]|jgi:hypothetical protein|nr:hypothetical protein [Verrucomicrobiae bacterium]
MNAKLRFRGFSLLLCPLLLAGCSTNLTKIAPYSEYIGRPLELCGPAAIINQYNEGDRDFPSSFFVHYALVDPGRNGNGTVIGELPKGHHVWIDGIRNVVVFDGGEHIVAYGHTTIPPGTNMVSFMAFWHEVSFCPP